MGDRLAHHIVHRDKSALNPQGLHNGTGDPLGQSEQGSHQLRRQIEQGIDVADRRDQHMPLEYRSMIQERDQLISSGHHGGSDFATCDLAEDVIH